MTRPRAYSPQSVEAARLLGMQIRLSRLAGRWSLEELAERVGVNHNTMRKVERGDLSVGLGPAFEAAAVLGVPLFDADPEHRQLASRELQASLALLPARARRPVTSIDDDF